MDDRPFGAPAPDFSLPGTDGALHGLDDIAGPRGTVIAFICNHCPYVKAVADRMARDAEALKAMGVGFVAICSNDAAQYPEDGFDRMAEFANAHGFAFPYLQDESQEVATAYGAVCTPEFFGYDAARRLRYRGRLDASGRQPAPEGASRELVEAMRRIAETGEGPEEQHEALGCSIKWKR